MLFPILLCLQRPLLPISSNHFVWLRVLVFSYSAPFPTLVIHGLPTHISHSNPATTMGRHPSRTPLNLNSSLTPSSHPERTELGKSANSKMPNSETTLTTWICATCGRRYEEPATQGPFITPPPTTECIVVSTEETFTHDKGGFVNLIIAGGATCEYVRVKHGETPVTEPEDAFSAPHVPIQQTLLSRTYCDPSVQVEGRHGRVRKVSGAVKATYDEEDSEDGEFWKTRCNDVDCIFRGNHCRYQCAMAETGKEPEAKAPAPKLGLRFRR